MLGRVSKGNRMTLKTKYIIAGIVVLFALVFLLGYQVGKNKLPAKVDTKIEEQLRAEIKELNEKLTESQLNYTRLKSEQKNKTKILVKNVDGSSTLKEVSSSVTNEQEVMSLQSKVTEQQNIITGLEREIKVHQVAENNCNGVFAGPGLESSWKPKGSAGAFFGHHMGFLTSDGDKDHGAYYNYVIPLN